MNLPLYMVVIFCIWGTGFLAGCQLMNYHYKQMKRDNERLNQVCGDQYYFIQDIEKERENE